MTRLKDSDLLDRKSWSKKYPGLGHSWEGAAWCAIHLSKIGRFNISDAFLVHLRNTLKASHASSTRLVGPWRGLGGRLLLADLACDLDPSFSNLIPIQIQRIACVRQEAKNNDYFGGYPGLLMILAGMRSKNVPAKLLKQCHHETLHQLRKITKSKTPICIGAAHGLAGLLMAAEVGNNIFSLKFSKSLLNATFDRITENQIHMENDGALWLRNTGDHLESVKTFRNAFCHGNAGIALALHTSYFVSGIKKYKKIAEKALVGALAIGNEHATFCCGGNGLRQILIEIYRQDSNREWLKTAKKMRNATALKNPGLLIGRLGDIYLKERLSNPDKLPFPTLEFNSNH